MPTHEVLTYESAKALWDAKAKPNSNEKGVPVHGSRTRMFRNANGSYTVRHTYRKYYQSYTAELFTVHPGDKYTLGDFCKGHRAYSSARNDTLWDRIRDLTPLLPKRGEGNRWTTPYGIQPDAGPKPKPSRAKLVHCPVWAAKGDYRYEQYQQGIAEHGSLEAWHEAYHRYCESTTKARKKISDWVDNIRVEPFPGMVFDANGVVSQRSIDREAQRKRREQREAQAEAQRQREAHAKEQARREKLAADAERKRKKALKEASKELRKISKEVAEALDVADSGTIQYVLDRKLEVNPDATVRMVKAVQPDSFVSRHNKNGSRTRYAPGATVKAPDYAPFKRCGNGLHFSPTFIEAKTWADHGAIGMECHVDLATMIVIDRNKVKAESCTVKQQLTEEQSQRARYAFDDTEAATPPALLGKW